MSGGPAAVWKRCGSCSAKRLFNLLKKLADRGELWEKALEDWDMRSSQVVDIWHNEGRAEGQLEARRDDLVALLEKRFGSLPKDLLQRIQDLSDVTRLRAALQQVLDIDSLDELQL
jgi:hypothetical protein